MPTAMLDVGPALGGGYRVARIIGPRCEGQLLFDTAGDVAAAARLCGLAVLTSDDAIAAACAALGVVVLPPHPFTDKNISRSEELL